MSLLSSIRYWWTLAFRPNTEDENVADAASGMLKAGTLFRYCKAECVPELACPCHTAKNEL